MSGQVSYIVEDLICEFLYLIQLVTFYAMADIIMAKLT